MSFEEIIAGQSNEIPAKIVVYGVPKIGKTRFAAEFPEPFIINIEGGLDYLPNKVRATPKLSSYDEVIGWLKHIYNDDKFTCGTLIIDTLDWLEELSQARLIKLNQATSINDPKVPAFAYFKGVINAAEDAIMCIKWIDAIYKKKGIKSVLIAHSTIKTIDLPNQEVFSKYQMKLSKSLAAKAMEWADLILFADWEHHITAEGKALGKKKPILRAGGDASFDGGGRMFLPETIPLNYESLVKSITQIKG